MNFARDLFKENPECLEFNEFLKQSEDAMESYEFGKSLTIIKGAIQACRDAISAKEEEEEEILAPEKKAVNILAFIIEIIALIILLISLLYYYRKKHLTSIQLSL